MQENELQLYAIILAVLIYYRHENHINQSIKRIKNYYESPIERAIIILGAVTRNIYGYLPLSIERKVQPIKNQGQ